MINLLSIRIRNFRAVSEVVFKPLEEGITGIFGPNGAGKTTFLSATMFALYGVRPPEASLGSLRRVHPIQAPEPDD
jgi:DNA repair protein SbcC/Rad50